MQITTPGKIILADMLPEKYKQVDAPLDAGGIRDLFTRMAKDLPREQYVKVLKDLNNFGNAVTTSYGGVASIHLNDLIIPPELAKMRRQLGQRLNAIAQNPELSSADKKRLIVDTVRKATPEIDKKVLEVLGSKDNSFGLLVKTKTRGNPVQLRQLVFGDLLTVDSRRRDIPYPTLRSYGEGVTPLQYWTASHGGRQGYYLVQKATADAGYFSKQIRGTVHRQVVTGDDCGKARGWRVNGPDENNVGSLLFADTKGRSGTVYKANTPITEDMLDDLPDRISIRSAITCGQREGVCAHCAGIRESGKLPDIGDAVGLNGVNSFLEGVTQAGLSSKHSGGESTSVKRVKRGLEAIDQFVNMPENFVGGAVTAPVDGVIHSITDAPQGGKFIDIGGTQVHAPADSEIKVKKGDRIEAGDMLTDGMPNISAIVEHKGLGAGRKAFVDSLYELLEENNASTSRKNLETFARGYVSKVEVTDPDGLQGWIYGDIADYNAIENKWEPREGTTDRDPRAALNQYLEKPVMHYSIGTRITPNVAQDLFDAGYDKVAVNEKEPPFKPYMPSAKQMQPTDADWITALSGENLTRSLLSHAQRGSDTDKNSVSMYPRLAMVSGNYPKPLTIE